MSSNPASINYTDPDLKAGGGAERAVRRKHVNDEAIASKPDQAGLEYGAEVRDAIKRSAT
jgi:hypothetical protein